MLVMIKTISRQLGLLNTREHLRILLEMQLQPWA